MLEIEALRVLLEMRQTKTRISAGCSSLSVKRTATSMTQDREVSLHCLALEEVDGSYNHEKAQDPRNKVPISACQSHIVALEQIRS